MIVKYKMLNKKKLQITKITTFFQPSAFSVCPKELKQYNFRFPHPERNKKTYNSIIQLLINTLFI